MVDRNTSPALLGDAKYGGIARLRTIARSTAPYPLQGTLGSRPIFSRVHRYRDFRLKGQGGKWHRSATTRTALGNRGSAGVPVRGVPSGPFRLQPNYKKYAISFTLDGVRGADNNDSTTVRTYCRWFVMQGIDWLLCTLLGVESGLPNNREE